MSEPRAALEKEGVEVPEGVTATQLTALVGEVLKAVIEARVTGHVNIPIPDVPLGSEVWTFHLRGHRQ